MIFGFQGEESHIGIIDVILDGVCVIAGCATEGFQCSLHRYAQSISRIEDGSANNGRLLDCTEG